ncbi:MAG: DUF2184 domain-containing protein [Myxococcaceae bacterium]|nr:MAG: DUF2184 domain-containing protein [Myxococcaceae bacterium]
MFNIYSADAAQQALGFLVSQTSYIEPQVVEVQYPEIQYPTLIPVDTAANEWAKSITYFSSDKVGKAGWFHHLAKDIHIADVERSQFEVGVEMADIGYRYSLQELGQAMMVPGTNLTTERASAARRAYEEFVDNLALRGMSDKNFHGIIDYPGITTVQAAEGAEGSTDWDSKTADEIMADINAILTGMWTSSAQIEYADTLLLPGEAMTILVSKRVPDTTLTILDFVASKNIVSFQTGRPIIIRAVRGLEDAGTGGTGRMVAYRRDPAVLKMHIPMPHRFLPVWQTGPLVYDIPGIFRVAGLEIRRPGAVRYLDGISGDEPS